MSEAAPDDKGEKASLDEGSTRLLMDLASRRYDLADRTYDALNTRLATLFGFNAFLVPAVTASFLNAPRKATVPGFLLAFWALSIVVVAVVCIAGLLARSVETLPDPAKMYPDWASRPAPDTAGKLIAQLNLAWESVTAATARKARSLNIGLIAVGVELMVVVVAVVLAARAS